MRINKPTCVFMVVVVFLHLACSRAPRVLPDELPSGSKEADLKEEIVLSDDSDEKPCAENSLDCEPFLSKLPDPSQGLQFSSWSMEVAEDHSSVHLSFRIVGSGELELGCNFDYSIGYEMQGESEELTYKGSTAAGARPLDGVYRLQLHLRDVANPGNVKITKAATKLACRDHYYGEVYQKSF